MKHMSTHEKMLAMLAMLFIMVGVGLRIYSAVSLKTGYSYDEAFTYVAATGHQGEYFNAALVPADERTDPWNKIVPASEWKRMMKPEAAMPFKRISHDLSHYDIHPPLYYWLLHPVTWLLGSGPKSGLMLNIMLAMLNLVLLFRIGNKTLLMPPLALVAMAIWLVTPTAIDADIEARSYELLTTFSLLYYLVLLRLQRDGENPVALLALIAISTLGMLTHFYFGFVIAGGVLWAVFRKGDLRPKLLYLAAQPIIIALFLAIFPEFFNMPGNHHFQQGVEEGQAFAGADFLDRLSVFVHYNTRFFVYYADSNWPKYLVQGMLAMIGVFAAFKYLSNRTAFTQRFQASKPLQLLFWLLGWNFLFSFGLYVAGIAPGQAVSGQYFSYIWPLLAIFCVFLLERVHAHWALVAMLLMLMAASSWFRTVADQRNYLHEVPEAWTEQANQSDLLLLTHRSMGKVIPIVQQVNDEIPTYLGGYDAASVAEFAHYKHIVLIDNEKQPRTALVEQLQAALPNHLLSSDTTENRYHGIRLHRFVAR